jgi:hypothetical protein
VALIRRISRWKFDRRGGRGRSVHNKLEILSRKKRRKPPPDDTLPAFTWPNEPRLAPCGMFYGVDHEVVVVPQGFFLNDEPGAITAVDARNRVEYVIHQSTAGFEYRWYSEVIFLDLNGDGRLDIVSVRSNFQIPPLGPPIGELVVFTNPGENLDKDTEWEETVLFSGMAPDVTLASHDWNEDGQVRATCRQLVPSICAGTP